MDTSARVFAINSTGYEGVQESYVSAIQSIGGLRLKEAVMPDETLPRDVTMTELIERKLILVD